MREETYVFNDLPFGTEFSKFAKESGCRTGDIPESGNDIPEIYIKRVEVARITCWFSYMRRRLGYQ